MNVRSALPLIWLIIALFALRWTFVEPYVVPTGSMEPTLKKGDRLYALKCAYDVRFPFTEWIIFRTGEVNRGDVILFKAPRTPDLTYVKRAIGLPGDEIEYKEGRLLVNGKEVEKDISLERDFLYDVDPNNDSTLYIENLDGVKHYVLLENLDAYDRRIKASQMSYLHIRVPKDHLFAVGDNRDKSYDSRFWGYVPTKNLKGKAMFIWYSSPTVETSSQIWNMIAGWFDPRSDRVGTIIN